MMARLGDLLPAAWMTRWLSQDPAEKTWTCPNCGVMLPREVRSGYYARRRCACEQQAEEARQRQGVPRTLQEALRQGQLGQTYCWLGQDWGADGLTDQTFASFEQRYQPAAYEQASAFANHPHGVLALYGSFGTGKTHLLAAIANALHARGQPCLFASAVSLFEAIGQRISQDQDYHALLTRAIQTPVLLLDDVDKPKASAFRQELYYHVIDGRTRAGRPLAFSCNCPPSDWDRYVGGAARSRLMMGLVPVQMSGIDYRLAGGNV